MRSDIFLHVNSKDLAPTWINRRERVLKIKRNREEQSRIFSDTEDAIRYIRENLDYRRNCEGRE